MAIVLCSVRCAACGFRVWWVGLGWVGGGRSGMAFAPCVGAVAGWRPPAPPLQPAGGAVGLHAHAQVLELLKDAEELKEIEIDLESQTVIVGRS